jgi:hypothetical protein
MQPIHTTPSQFTNEELEQLSILESKSITNSQIQELLITHPEENLILFLESCIADSEHDGEDESHLHTTLFTIQSLP